MASTAHSGTYPCRDFGWLPATLRKPLLFEPGHGWSYSNPGYWLLSQILQKETELDLDQVIQRFVAEPLRLPATRLVRGQFADDLPWYPAEWVWHGVVVSTARDMVHFMRSSAVEPLLGKLTRVPVEHPLWTDPHYAYGLMVEPDVMYGHNGDGPLYSASCFHFLNCNLTGCVLMSSETQGQAMQTLLARWPDMKPGLKAQGQDCLVVGR